jgi:hypothetical protein
VFLAGYLLGVLVHPEYGSSTFLRNVGELVVDVPGVLAVWIRRSQEKRHLFNFVQYFLGFMKIPQGVC